MLNNGEQAEAENADNYDDNNSSDVSANSQQDSDISDNGSDRDMDENMDNGNEEYIEHAEDGNYHQPPGWNNYNNVQLYDLSDITLGESMFAILSFYLRHNLSLACLSDLLSLLNLHCREEGNQLPKTVYTFKKFFQNIQFPIVRRYYCSVCCQRLGAENQICENCNGAKSDFFIEIPVAQQLRALYNRQGFVELLNHRFQRRRFSEGCYEDIYDGAVYKELTANNGILSDPRNISFMYYSDGVSIFRSSRYEIWPFYFVINELPYNERTKISNALLAGLWFGKKKPVPTTFLHHIRNDMLLIRNGIDIVFGNPLQQRTVKGIVICGTADLPAKAKFLNFKAPNSEFGCTKCTIRSYNLRRGVNVFPFRVNLQMRTEAETWRHGQEALQLPLYNGQRQDRFGVKGPSILSTFVHQFIRTAAVDVMHCAYINLPKTLLQFWFDSKFAGNVYSLRAHKGIISNRLSHVSPPSFVQRLTRSLDDVSYWKAHEYKSFIFYYSLPVLSDKMSELYLEHHKLLVLGLYLLSQRSISNVMVELASTLLSEYVSQFEVLYGPEAMTCNLHQLLHLPKIVQDLGPAWVTSCFPFEDLNGKLKKLVKGSRHAELQICSGVAMLIKLSELKVNVPHGRAFDFAEKLFDTHRGLNLTEIGRKMAVVGKYKKIHQPSPAVMESLLRANIEGRNYFEFHRLLKYSVVYGSTLYNRVVKTKSYCVKFCSDGTENVGFINCYLKVTNCDCVNFCMYCNPKFVAIIQKCDTSLDFTALETCQLSFVHTLLGQGDIVAIDVSNIISMCFVVSVADLNVTYIVEPVNLIESE